MNTSQQNLSYNSFRKMSYKLPQNLIAIRHRLNNLKKKKKTFKRRVHVPHKKGLKQTPVSIVGCDITLA